MSIKPGLVLAAIGIVRFFFLDKNSDKKIEKTYPKPLISQKYNLPNLHDEMNSLDKLESKSPKIADSATNILLFLGILYLGYKTYNHFFPKDIKTYDSNKLDSSDLEIGYLGDSESDKPSNDL